MKPETGTPVINPLSWDISSFSLVPVFLLSFQFVLSFFLPYTKSFLSMNQGAQELTLCTPSHEPLDCDIWEISLHFKWFVQDFLWGFGLRKKLPLNLICRMDIHVVSRFVENNHYVTDNMNLQINEYSNQRLDVSLLKCN